MVVHGNKAQDQLHNIHTLEFVCLNHTLPMRFTEDVWPASLASGHIDLALSSGTRCCGVEAGQSQGRERMNSASRKWHTSPPRPVLEESTLTTRSTNCFPRPLSSTPWLALRKAKWDLGGGVVVQRKLCSRFRSPPEHYQSCLAYCFCTIQQRRIYL